MATSLSRRLKTEQGRASKALNSLWRSAGALRKGPYASVGRLKVRSYLLSVRRFTNDFDLGMVLAIPLGISILN